MKTRFSTVDLMAAIAELQSFLHMRVVNVYDVDNKTYLFKLSRQEEKAVLLLESGVRIHKTEYEWPKNHSPSSFTMKLRKHVHNRRLEQIKQLGIDRVVDLQFGCNEAAYHVILELYDKGNLILTDYEYTILNVLRPRTEGENVRFLVHEKYPVDHAKQMQPLLSVERWHEILLEAKQGENLKKILNPRLEYGPALIDHVLLKANFPDGVKLGKNFNINEDVPRLVLALEEADKLFRNETVEGQKGFIIQKEEKKVQALNEENSVYMAYIEFHPFLFCQYEKMPHLEFPLFNKAVDDYFAKIESQKLDVKIIQKEKEAFKKLENVTKDHEQRIDSLQKAQEEDRYKAELIEMNLDLVQSAIVEVQKAIANQVHWKDISNLIAEASQAGDPVAAAIKSLKLEINNITLLLRNPYEDNDADDDKGKNIKPTLIDIDLDLSAYANAKKYYDKKRKAAMKQQKTVESSVKAYKSAEKRTKQTLKEAAVISNINRARKTHWFEKFLWFVSSENYLVIGGHDQQQNEMIVKRYMKPGDLYVHADLHGASSIIIKNPTGVPVPPKTLNEAGTMAVCSSVAWDSKVVTSAWWVHHDQVSKTAPTGEYLTTGSFMIRGKKNYLPPCYLIMGFGFLFRLDEESVINHKDERKIRTLDIFDDTSSSNTNEVEETEICLEDLSDSENEDAAGKELKTDEPEVTEQLETIESEDEEKAEFPDTVVDFEQIEGEKFFVKTRGVPTVENGLENEPTSIIEPGLTKKQKKKSSQKQPAVAKCEEIIEKEPASNASATGAPQIKRGQKYKLKKIKEKYKDQDEVDRELAMSILQPAGVKKNKKGAKDGSKGKKGETRRPPPTQVAHQAKSNAADNAQIAEQAAEEIGSDDEKEIKQQAAEDAGLLESLTGLPTLEDILLYAVPVCAPYNAIVNYKYKVKLTPGTGRRGKAAKAALNIFTHDRTITNREKDLLKSVKDQDISRNLPGKVKLSSSQLSRKTKS